METEAASRPRAAARPRATRFAPSHTFPTGSSPLTAGRREPTHEEISVRAYYIYLARGGASSDPLADWLRAERELRRELNQPFAATVLRGAE